MVRYHKTGKASFLILEASFVLLSDSANLWCHFKRSPSESGMSQRLRFLILKVPTVVPVERVKRWSH